MKLKTKILALCGAAAAAASISSAASAHLVTFGWKDNGAGGVVLWGEHWHYDQSSPYSANGGIHIQKSDGTGPIVLAQWTGVLNNKDVTELDLTGYQADPGNWGSGYYDDWFFTAPIQLGNGTYTFYTGPNCCIDTMTSGVTVTITGVTSVKDGTLAPGAVPEPATWAMMIGGFGMVGGAMRSARRRTKVSVSFA